MSTLLIPLAAARVLLQCARLVPTATQARLVMCARQAVSAQGAKPRLSSHVGPTSSLTWAPKMPLNATATLVRVQGSLSACQQLTSFPVHASLVDTAFLMSYEECVLMQCAVVNVLLQATVAHSARSAGQGRTAWVRP